LTGLANRKRLDEVLDQEWRRAIRSETPLSLVVIDVDLFKEYNDRYGHPAGDRCLAMIAGILGKCATRAGDLLARYGGEEFIALLVQTDGAGAVAVAERMRMRILEEQIPHEASHVNQFVTISCGVATVVPSQDMQAHHLYEMADEVLYEAKNRGRNQVVLSRAQASVIARPAGS
jgi:diguanylate cyclase (GGDEF)-like protein